MSTGLVKAIKQAALDAVNNGQPTELRYGIVTSVSPLKIQLNPQLTLPNSVLVIGKTLADTFELGDEIALLRQKGGQSYLILDNLTKKIGGSGSSGEGGVTDHADLTGRDSANQHPISAITNLRTELDSKFDDDDIITTAEILEIMNS